MKIKYHVLCDFYIEYNHSTLKIILNHISHVYVVLIGFNYAHYLVNYPLFL